MTTQVSWMPPRWLVWTFLALALAAFGYVLWWRHTASLLKSTLAEFQAQTEAQGGRASWASLTTSGFPMRLRANLQDPIYENRRTGLTWEARGLSLEMLPWSLTQFNFAAEGRQALKLGQAAIAGEAKQSGLSLRFRNDGVPKQLDIAASNADATISQPGTNNIALKGESLALHWRIDPDDPDPSNGRDYDIALNGKILNLSGVALPFGNNIQDIKIQVTLRDVPALTKVDGTMDIVAWRSQGAPLTVRKLTFISGGVDIQGAGELQLDRDQTLAGQLNLNVGGFDKIVALLTAAGAIPPEAKSTLFVTSTMLSATGAKVPVPLTFKSGKTFLGPVEIGPAPRLVY